MASDRKNMISELLKSRREEGQLEAQLKERKQTFESLQPREDELLKETKRAREFISTFDLYLQDGRADCALEKVRKEVTAKEAEIQRLKEECAELKERKQKLWQQVQRNSVYVDYMQEVLNMTKFDDVQVLTDHFQSLLHFRGHLCQKENETEEQVSGQRKAQLMLEDQHHLLRLRKNNQLANLRLDLERTHSEAELWRKKWNHIQETAAKKTLVLGQIKVSVLNLYEVIGGTVGEKGVPVNDTETQLEKIKNFIEDHDDIVRQHHATLQLRYDGATPPNHTLTHHESSEHISLKRNSVNLNL